MDFPTLAVGCVSLLLGSALGYWTACHDNADTHARALRKDPTMAIAVISPITPRPASGPGALDGFGFECSCGGGHALSLVSLARQWRMDHARWHQGRGDDVVLADDDRMHRVYLDLYADMLAA